MPRTTMLQRAVLLPTICVLILLALPTGAPAAEGDLYAPGTTYRATTYSGHSNFHLWPDTDKSHIADIVATRNPAGRELSNTGNYRLPIHAPGDGTVEQVSEGYGGGWGNSLIWTSADGREQIHVAHLDSVVKTGAVNAGDVIGREGSTGFSSPSNFNHLHVSRRVDGEMASVVLSGVTLDPYPHTVSPAGQSVHEAATEEETAKREAEQARLLFHLTLEAGMLDQ